VSRRQGRILAFQALYAWEVGKIEQETLFDFSWAELKTLEKNRETTLAFAKLLVVGTLEHIAEIDEAINRHLQNWDLSRINKVDLSILRISVYPLLYQKDIHPTIVIDEAIDIARAFSNDDSFKFINAILDAIRKEMAV
jgi:N utilization substance protein B